MYRQYRNPFAIQDKLDALREDYRNALENGADEETLMYLQMDINETEQELNFAWQDDEYDSDNYSGDWED